VTPRQRRCPRAPAARRTVLRLAAALAGTAWLGVRAQPPVRPEAVEAAYLHKLPGFVEWPPQAFTGPAAPIVIGIAGAPVVQDELARIARGRLVIGRAVEARIVDAAADLPRDLNLLFIGAGAGAAAALLVDAARARHALVVTDLPDGLALGAAIAFVEVDGRLRFEVSLAGARKCELKLSSQLMGVAWKVLEDAP
jgi:hypothetical protein